MSRKPGEGGSGTLARLDAGGRPAALVAEGARELYVALQDSTIKHSTDAGATWTVRATPYHDE